MATMYELTNDYLAVLDMATDPEIPSEVIVDTLEGIEGEIEIKAENIAKVIKELDGVVVNLKSEEIRLHDRRNVIENRVKALKETLYNAMKITGKEKFKTDLFSFNIQKNPAKLVIDDEAKIPCQYLIEQPPKIDTSAIKDLLKNNNAVDYAHLEQGESLRIK
jgi:hypothetical protein